MNILLINHYAGSPDMGMEFRPYYLAKEWIKAGHRVLIVGATYSHLRKIQPLPGSQNIDGVDYLWLKTNVYQGNGVKRLLSMFRFVRQIRRHMKAFSAFAPEVVIASSTYPLDVRAAYDVARKTGAKLIYEIHDLWPLSPMELGHMSPRHPFIVLMQKAEDFAYAKVDKVVSILPAVREHVEAHGLSPEKLDFVPNGIVKSDWEHPEALPLSHQQLIDELKAENRFLVCFTGAHGIANALTTLIDGVGGLEQDGVSLLLVGGGPEKSKLESYAQRKRYSNVHFLDPIGKKSIPTLLKQMDVLYVGLQDEPLFRFGISPNKIFDYMMSARPIIQSIKAGNDLVRDADCGCSIVPENAEEVGKAVLQLKGLRKEERDALGRNGYEYVNKYHTYDVLAEKFLDIMKGLLKQ